MVCLIGHFGVEVLQVHGSVDDGVEADGFVGGEVGGPVVGSVDVREVWGLRDGFGEIRVAAAAVLGVLGDVAEGELLLLLLLLRWRFYSG